MAEAMKTFLMWKKNGINHWVLHSLLIVIIAILQCLMLILSAICHFVRTTLFITCKPTQIQLCTCLNIAYVKDEDANCQARSGGITQNIDLGYACFQEKYYRVCIARAAVNKSVCEDFQSEHMQFATAAVSTPFTTYVIASAVVLFCWKIGEGRRSQKKSEDRRFAHFSNLPVLYCCTPFRT